MKRAVLFTVIFVRMIFALPAQKYVNIGDLELLNGGVLQDCRIGYRTIGRVNTDSSNIILYPTWFGGTSAHIWGLIDSHDFLDSNRYFIIAADALGNGISTSPSNSTVHPGRAFPNITINDMVRAEHELLKQLGIKKLHAVTGGSMGGMQGFEFITAYPDMTEKAVLYVCTPRESAYDLLRREAALQLIELGRKYDIPENEYMKTVRINQALNGKTPDYYAREMSLEDVPQYLKSFENHTPGIFPADNYYCQSKAISCMISAGGMRVILTRRQSVSMPMFLL
ncbi:MAG: alpha/beta fold hydrolase [Candidatus Marinimicrobia bacterium]|nr:alpha/beta fold hydrolase [Candidatus Neomarinimicrobiota bacterium]